MFDSLLNDIRYSWRGLLKRPGFTAIALVILALGIGANTAIFTLINAVVLKPLPVNKPEELVLFNDSPSEGTRTSDGDISAGRWDLFSYAAYRYFREHNRSFQELSAFRSGESRVSARRTDAQSGEAPQRASGHLVSGNYFAVLGVNAMQGRVLTNEDDSSAAHPTAVISNGYWKQKLNADAQIVGKNILLNGTTLSRMFLPTICASAFSFCFQYPLLMTAVGWAADESSSFVRTRPCIAFTPSTAK